MTNQEEIQNQCLSDNREERKEALDKLRDNFSLLPDKQQAWNCLINLTDDKSRDVRINAAYTIGSAFSHMPDKQLAWNYLIKLANDKDIWVRSQAYSALGSTFIQISDKQQAWKDLIKLANDEETLLRSRDVYAYSSMFVHMLDKQQEWKDPVKLSSDEKSYTIHKAFSAVGYIFSRIPDRHEMWDDLVKLTSNDEGWVISGVASALESVFAHIPDKQEAWNDLIKLINSENKLASHRAASVLGSAFFHFLDKKQSWNDLHRLCNDKDSIVRSEVASALGFVFSHLSDKQQAWDDLYRLTNDEDSRVRREAISALGSSFAYIPEEQQVWNDLIELSNDEKSDNRAYINQSLGKISIFKASQAENEEDYKRELETAISFFEKAAQESGGGNPSQFCLPFYRSFYTIIFQKQEEAKEEVDKYLAEAKDAVRGSKNKELLFEAVNNLANALKEVQNLENLDLEAKKGELNFYRQYCDRATEIMIETEKAAPFATIAMRKGLPILDRNLKGIIEEIQEKAKAACQEAKGTPAEHAACAVNDFARKLKIGSPEYLVVQIENLVFLLKSYIPKIEENNLILDRIDKILREEDVVIQYTLLNSLIPQIINIHVSEKTNPILSEIKFLRVSVDRLVESIDELQNPQEYLEVIQQNLEVIKSEIPEMRGKIDEVLYELYSPLSTDQKLKIAIPIIPSLVSYEMETNVPKLVADKIDELKNLVLRFKKSE